MRIDHDNYEVYNNSRIIHGTNIEIDYSVYYKRDCDISDLIQMSAKDVERFRNKSIANENKAYEKENGEGDDFSRPIFMLFLGLFYTQRTALHAYLLLSCLSLLVFE